MLIQAMDIQFQLFGEGFEQIEFVVEVGKLPSKGKGAFEQGRPLFCVTVPGLHAKIGGNPLFVKFFEFQVIRIFLVISQFIQIAENFFTDGKILSFSFIREGRGLGGVLVVVSFPGRHGFGIAFGIEEERVGGVAVVNSRDDAQFFFKNMDALQILAEGVDLDLKELYLFLELAVFPGEMLVLIDLAKYLPVVVGQDSQQDHQHNSQKEYAVEEHPRNAKTPDFFSRSGMSMTV